MALTLADVTDEVKSRAVNLGTFNGASAIARMRYAIVRGCHNLYNFRNWNWRNATYSLVTTQGNLGPYDAPELFMRFAALRKVSLFGYVDKDVIGPILATSSKVYTPYFQIQDGKIYFFDDPGDATLTLNYIAEPGTSVEDGPLGELLDIIPNGLLGALVDYTLADLMRWVPSGSGLVQGFATSAKEQAILYWENEFIGDVQRGISPKGLNGLSIDNHAEMPAPHSVRRFW